MPCQCICVKSTDRLSTVHGGLHCSPESFNMGVSKLRGALLGPEKQGNPTGSGFILGVWRAPDPAQHSDYSVGRGPKTSKHSRESMGGLCAAASAVSQL